MSVNHETMIRRLAVIETRLAIAAEMLEAAEDVAGDILLLSDHLYIELERIKTRPCAALAQVRRRLAELEAAQEATRG